MKRTPARVARGIGTRRIYPAFCLLPSAFCLLYGCADAKQPTSRPTSAPLTLEQQHEQMLKDPFAAGSEADPNYMKDNGLDENGKPTLKSDVDKFMNP